MVVQHNMNALNAYNKLNTNVAGLKKSSEKLSSGYRINRAGDDAAGLAISEKMRSQIRGLNQAKRNAQDGISMIQTFEGAAQESHSILQRMKELASEAANGTYQNEVDRDAIQLEFDQLNDELDQIADTDFNGTVMLNGGQMADGTKAIDGKFDYANGTRDPRQLTAADVNKVDFQKFNDADASKGATQADTVWNKLNSTWDRSATGVNHGPDSVDVTFEYDATTKKWSCISATNGADSEQITVSTDTTNGGFAFQAGGVDVANVVLNQTDLQNGDTLTLTLNNPYAARSAPTNAGAIMSDSTGFKEGADPAATTLASANLTVAINTTNATDAKMTETLNNIFNALDGATVEMSYTKTTATAAGDIKLTLSDGTAYTGETTGTKMTLADGKTNVFFKATADGVITVSTAKSDGTKGDDLFTITPTKSVAADDSSGKLTYKIGVENNAYDSKVSPSVDVKAPDNSAVSKSNSNDAATAPLTYTDHLVLQTGARTKDSVDFTFSYKTDGMGDLQANMNISSREEGLGTKSLSLKTQKDANAAIDKIDNAINKVSMVRATFGATQNRLEHKVENLTTTAENLTEAESGIRDTDMASEMLNYTKFNVLQQAAQSMLAQANQQPQSILQLLG
ncbi:MAG: flagellin [Oscillospiraceae bacterium]